MFQWFQNNNSKFNVDKYHLLKRWNSVVYISISEKSVKSENRNKTYQVLEWRGDCILIIMSNRSVKNSSKKLHALSSVSK